MMVIVTIKSKMFASCGCKKGMVPYYPPLAEHVWIVPDARKKYGVPAGTAKGAQMKVDELISKAKFMARTKRWYIRLSFFRRCSQRR